MRSVSLILAFLLTMIVWAIYGGLLYIISKMSESDLKEADNLVSMLVIGGGVAVVGSGLWLANLITHVLGEED